jgi:mono/diheme cytochrome c family protein
MRKQTILVTAAAVALAAAASAQQAPRGLDPYMPFVVPPQGNTPEAAWPVPPGLPALPARLGLGNPATAEEIAGWDISVRADGHNLPKGRGTVAEGEELYVAHCASCHGDFGEGVDRWPALIGGRGTLATDAPRRTIGSYWPYAPVVFDYIRRAMPYAAPQSLTTDEYYAITAYVLHLNELLPADATLDQDSIKTIRMPNRDGFILEARPDTPNEACMQNCRKGRPVRVTMDSRQFVPPGSGSGFSEPQ